MIRARVIAEHAAEDDGQRLRRVVFLLTTRRGAAILTNVDVWLAADADDRWATPCARWHLWDALAAAAAKR